MLRTIGLMSGTSLDGVDAAWLETDGERIGAFGPTLTLPYDDRLRADLRRILDRAPTLDPDDRAAEQRGGAADRVSRPRGGGAGAAGGPDRLPRPDHPAPAGSAADLADRRRRPNWRGGPACRWRTISARPTWRRAARARRWRRCITRRWRATWPKPLAVLNIGGVANVTWIGADGALVAFDTGPGNGPLDDWIARRTGSAFDRDGAMARSGRVDQAVLGRLLARPVFRRARRRNRSTGWTSPRRWPRAGSSDLSPADGAATLVAFTAAAVARGAAAGAAAALAGHRRRAAQSGDHARRCGTALGVPVEPVEALGWDGDALEAQCFGFLAARVAAGLPISFPGTTGVPRPTGGRMTAPAATDAWLRRRSLNARPIRCRRHAARMG